MPPCPNQREGCSFHDLDGMCLACHVCAMTTIEIPIRELHARTGHFVRKAAADMRVVITDNGKPIAQLQPLSTPATGHTKRPRWKDRVLLPGYAAIMNKPVPGDSTAAISEDRDRGNDW